MRDEEEGAGSGVMDVVVATGLLVGIVAGLDLSEGYDEALVVDGKGTSEDEVCGTGDYVVEIDHAG